MDGNQILRQAAEHFSRVVAESELGQVSVPEWNTTLYYPRVLSLNAKSRVVEAQNKGGLHHMAQIVIECARDEDGKKLFRPNHLDALMKEADSNVIIRIAGEMASALVPEDDQMGKFAAPGSSAQTMSSDSDTD